MDTFFNQYVDMTAVLLAFLAPLILTLFMKRKAGRKVRAVPSYLLLFGPCGMLVFIFFHLFENSYRAIAAAITGSFVYNFHFYSLILLGIVVAVIGYVLLRACWTKCTGETSNNRRIFQVMIVAAIVTSPLIPITPLAAVPGICSVFSLLGLPFVRRNSRDIPAVPLQQPVKASAI